MAEGWGKIKAAAQYAGLSERTMRDLLKNGLKCSRLPSGTILIKFTSIDEYLEQFTDHQNKIDEIVDSTLKELT